MFESLSAYAVAFPACCRSFWRAKIGPLSLRWVSAAWMWMMLLRRTRLLPSRRPLPAGAQLALASHQMLLPLHNACKLLQAGLLPLVCAV